MAEAQVISSKSSLKGNTMTTCDGCSGVKGDRFSKCLSPAAKTTSLFAIGWQ